MAEALGEHHEEALVQVLPPEQPLVDGALVHVEGEREELGRDRLAAHLVTVRVRVRVRVSRSSGVMASPRTSSISSSAPTARLSRWILSRLFERKPPRKSSKSRYGRGVCDRAVEADAFAAGGALLCQ